MKNGVIVAIAKASGFRVAMSKQRLNMTRES
jgi:hypothetical protein